MISQELLEASGLAFKADDFIGTNLSIQDTVNQILCEKLEVRYNSVEESSCSWSFGKTVHDKQFILCTKRKQIPEPKEVTVTKDKVAKIFDQYCDSIQSTSFFNYLNQKLFGDNPIENPKPVSKSEIDLMVTGPCGDIAKFRQLLQRIYDYGVEK